MVDLRQEYQSTVNDYQSIINQLNLLIEQESEQNIELKEQLIKLRSQNGKLTFDIDNLSSKMQSDQKSLKNNQNECKNNNNNNKLSHDTNQNTQQLNKDNKNSNKTKKNKKPIDLKEPDISLLDIRVGLIESIENHPDADSLFVETVDFGNFGKKTIISGLRGLIAREELHNRKCIFVYNLKPAKMRGIMSEGMILVAKSNDKETNDIDVLKVPDNVELGSNVIFPKYPPDHQKLIDGKSKAMVKIKEHLKTNSLGYLSYKDDVAHITKKGNDSDMKCHSKFTNCFVS